MQHFIFNRLFLFTNFTDALLSDHRDSVGDFTLGLVKLLKMLLLFDGDLLIEVNRNFSLEEVTERVQHLGHVRHLLDLIRRHLFDEGNLENVEKRQQCLEHVILEKEKEIGYDSALFFVTYIALN